MLICKYNHKTTKNKKRITMTQLHSTQDDIDFSCQLQSVNWSRNRTKQELQAFVARKMHELSTR